MAGKRRPPLLSFQPLKFERIGGSHDLPSSTGLVFALAEPYRTFFYGCPCLMHVYNATTLSSHLSFLAFQHTDRGRWRWRNKTHRWPLSSHLFVFVNLHLLYTHRPRIRSKFLKRIFISVISLFFFLLSVGVLLFS
ncbi:hypothetical protein L1987_77264 [Smallanthus sonchifolius]|uniref:Uncharacterized protein n=1 Tax=Smallanthus sonchifolius TaxID=185202 RepID=A0ACB8ZDW5_9ASTR|nr:hypothetical protein L1987_77264 [Smallanthus sonchifolius]